MFKNLIKYLVLVSGIGIGVAQSNDATLGALVEQSHRLLYTEVNAVALIQLQEPIKVAIRQHSFTKKTYKTFKAYNNAKVIINYIDSLDTKPSYLSISLADKTALLKAINQNNNTANKALLQTNSKIKLVTTVKMALNANELKTVLEAEEVFLQAYGKKSYGLGIYNKGNKMAVIPLVRGIIFNVETSNFCWQELKGKLQIVNITESKRCPKDTHGSADKTKTKINYYKF